MEILEKMLSGQVYDPQDPQLKAMQEQCAKDLWTFNSYAPDQKEEKKQYMKEHFASCKEGCCIEGPLYANWGGKFLSLGSKVYVNFHWTIVDDAPIMIGDNVMIGPNVVILPGVRIGKNSVIGAGSVVTKDIPENVVAFGNPCKVQRKIE